MIFQGKQIQRTWWRWQLKHLIKTKEFDIATFMYIYLFGETLVHLLYWSAVQQRETNTVLRIGNLNFKCTQYISFCTLQSILKWFSKYLHDSMAEMLLNAVKETWSGVVALAFN